MDGWTLSWGFVFSREKYVCVYVHIAGWINRFFFFKEIDALGNMLEEPCSIGTLQFLPLSLLGSCVKMDVRTVISIGAGRQ